MALMVRLHNELRTTSSDIEVPCGGPQRYFTVLGAMLCFFNTVCSSGCKESWDADYSGIQLVEVAGTIQLDSEPLPRVTVIFEAADKSASFGRTDEQGRYLMKFDSTTSGVTPGRKTVRIRLGGGESSEDAPSEGAERTATTAARIPPCYDATSELQVNVEGRSQTFNFDLKSDCSTRSPTT